jgi:quercetin dioxygenase-like cupin family protein
MAITNRRVVTGLDADGRSCVLFDAPLRVSSDASLAIAWRSDRVPADNDGAADPGGGDFTLDLVNGGGSTFLMVQLLPGRDTVTMHATNSLDYLVVLQGHVLLVLEAGEVVLNPGDVIVDRGVLHGWKCAGDEPALMAAITLPAAPLGAGARIAS